MNQESTRQKEGRISQVLHAHTGTASPEIASSKVLHLFEQASPLELVDDDIPNLNAAGAYSLEKELGFSNIGVNRLVRLKGVVCVDRPRRAGASNVTNVINVRQTIWRRHRSLRLISQGQGWIEREERRPIQFTSIRCPSIAAIGLYLLGFYHTHLVIINCTLWGLRFHSPRDATDIRHCNRLCVGSCSVQAQIKVYTSTPAVSPISIWEIGRKYHAIVVTII